MNSEENRNERRDRKRDKRKNGMRVDSSARKLAEIKRDKLVEFEISYVGENGEIDHMNAHLARKR